MWRTVFGFVIDGGEEGEGQGGGETEECLENVSHVQSHNIYQNSKMMRRSRLDFSQVRESERVRGLKRVMISFYACIFFRC